MPLPEVLVLHSMLSKLEAIGQKFAILAISVKEAYYLSGHMLSPSLLVVHDSRGCGKNNIAELTRWQQLDNPLLKIGNANVVAGRDDASLIDSAVQLNDDLARPVVVDFLELADVAVSLHDAQEFDNDL